MWRLAVEILGSSSISRAEGGPSADVWQRGRELVEQRCDSWYEDALSDHELDVICGVYKVYTGKCGLKPEMHNC